MAGVLHETGPSGTYSVVTGDYRQVEGSMGFTHLISFLSQKTNCPASEQFGPLSNLHLPPSTFPRITPFLCLSGNLHVFTVPSISSSALSNDLCFLCLTASCDKLSLDASKRGVCEAGHSLPRYLTYIWHPPSPHDPAQDHDRKLASTYAAPA